MSKILPIQMTTQEPLMAPREVLETLPATITQIHFVEQSRKQILRILEGLDKRLLLILGPCSIHDSKSALHYAKKMKELSGEISDLFFPVMRFYFEKPRSKFGWKGLVYDPFLDGSCDLQAGILLTRSLLLELAQLEIPAAAEILDPLSVSFFGDLLSWGCIGARTSASQIHRQITSGLPMPIGFKNTTDGNVDVAIQAILSAKSPHTYLGMNELGQACVIRSQGNPHCHLVLRGGEGRPNYDATSIKDALNRLEKVELKPQLLVDCSHDNSGKDHNKQVEVFEQVIGQILAGNRSIRGLILESHLRAGNQPIPAQPHLLKYAVSVTDACIDWETTEGIVQTARKALMTTPASATSSGTISDAPNYAFI